MNEEDEQDEELCAVCLQKLHHPTKLPCGHIFCFLCVKGVAFQSRKCAMCRSHIPSDYLDHPVLLEQLSPQQQELEEPQLEYQWYYEGRNGWWKYDERSNVELETKFANNEGECILLLAGALYNVDFSNMTQVKCSDQTRRRRVKRDTPSLPSKGIAGIKITTTNTEPIKTDNDENSNRNNVSVDEVIEIIDDDNDDVEIVGPVPVNVEREQVDDVQVINVDGSEQDSSDTDVVLVQFDTLSSLSNRPES